MLHLVATPIGNLKDISLRAIELLKSCDYILCEDTRHSGHLLKHYEIKKPLKSYHRFNEAKQEEKLLEDLKGGLEIALISDAGTPTLCDPGYELVRKCQLEGIKVTSLPGPCAAIVALTLSGFTPFPFQFIGFFPKKSSELRKTLELALIYEGTTIAYESPHRVEETLSIIAALDPMRQLSIARELTKLYEESLTGTAPELHAHFQTKPPRGEFVLLISAPTEKADWSHLSIKEHVELLFTSGNLKLGDVIKMVAQLRNLPKREVYNTFHHS